MTFKIFMCCLYLILTITGTIQTSNNISCYQCIKNDMDEKCQDEDLKPCPLVSDRCVTHISKTAVTGFTIKRECGLGPCEFDDVMTNKGLGLDNCDQRNDEYFCLFCCTENGCNHNSALFHRISITLLITTISLVTIYNRFQPPYVLEKWDKV